MKNVSINYPEMQGKSSAEIQAEFVGIVNKYRVTSKNEIQVKRGIEYTGKVEKFGANNRVNEREGWFKYYMTEKAFKAFTESNKVELNILLD